MTAIRLNLDVGEVIQLQSMMPGNAGRYAVKVVGYLPGHSLIVTTPERKGRVLLVREGQRFAARMLSGGSVYGFVTTVLRSCSQPYPYLHLDYPTDMESIVVRNAPRETICIKASARNTKDPRDDAHHHGVELVDLSSTGACLTASIPVADVGDQLELQMRLKVYEVEEDLAIAADVRNRSTTDDGLSHRYGVEFRTLNAYQKLLIYSFVLEHTLNREVMDNR